MMPIKTAILMPLSGLHPVMMMAVRRAGTANDGEIDAEEVADAITAGDAASVLDRDGDGALDTGGTKPELLLTANKDTEILYL